MCVIDGRFPWLFRVAPSCYILAEYIPGKKSASLDQKLLDAGFRLQGKSLEKLPEALADGKLLTRLAAKRFRFEFPMPKKAHSYTVHVDCHVHRQCPCVLEVPKPTFCLKCTCDKCEGMRAKHPQLCDEESEVG